MLSEHVVRYFYALESVGYAAAIYSWWRVWRRPERDRLSMAALCTFSGFAVKIVRVAIAIVARST